MPIIQPWSQSDQALLSVEAESDDSLWGKRRKPRHMLSVIIPTRNSERALVPTLAALVPGATAGLVSEVLVADAGSQDDTAAVADVAGCNFIAGEAPLAGRLKAAAAAARAPWLLFLRPGTVLDAPWTGEVGRFIQQTAHDRRAAVFRRGGPSQSALREFFLLCGGRARRPAPPRAGAADLQTVL